MLPSQEGNTSATVDLDVHVPGGCLDGKPFLSSRTTAMKLPARLP